VLTLTLVLLSRNATREGESQRLCSGQLLFNGWLTRHWSHRLRAGPLRAFWRGGYGAGLQLVVTQYLLREALYLTPGIQDVLFGGVFVGYAEAYDVAAVELGRSHVHLSRMVNLGQQHVIGLIASAVRRVD